MYYKAHLGQCSAGTSSTAGASSCTNCAAGFYSNTARASSCSPHRAVVRAPLEHGRKALSPGWRLGAERSERVRGRPCGKWLRDDRSGPRCGASFDARLAAAGGGCEPTLWPRDGPAKKKGSAERRVESGFWKALSARGSIFEDAEKNEANCGFRIAEDGWAGMGVVGGDFWSEQSGPRAAAKAWTA